MKRATVAVLAAIAVTAPATACGPHFPNQVLANGDNRVLQMPSANFADEMDRLRPAGEPPFKAVLPTTKNYWTNDAVFDQSVEIDIAEVDAGLSENHVPQDRRADLMKQYRDVRELIAIYARANSDQRERGSSDPVKPLPDSAAVPDGIPAEFADYLRGLIQFHQGKVANARATWTKLLEQPADRRSHRGGWAAFMLGKSYLTDDPAKSTAFFQKARDLLKDKPDTLGLASSSLGWEARADLNAGKCGDAIGLYMRQQWTGDPTANWSLERAARQAFTGDPKLLVAMAKDPVTRRVLTAFVAADGGRWSGGLLAKEKKLVPIWLAAVESAGVTDVAGADRLAWAAYSNGEYETARRWVDRAPADAPVGQWVRAKLLLRAGMIDQAAAVLATVVKSFPDRLPAESRKFDNIDERCEIDLPRDIGTDLAILQLTRSQYVDSLRLLMRADHWMDAAYVAERVLTVDELKQYVDDHVPERSAVQIKADPENDTTPWHGSPENLRHLLARRLTRAGRWKEARPYYPVDLRAKLDDYVGDIRDGHDQKRNNADRAKSFVAAARLAHDSGMELIGTELSPDYHCYDGDFENYRGDRPRGEDDKAVAPSADELKRFKESTPDDDRRFHYRYVALDHAWEAALLMPDDTDDLARLLCEAGGWVKAKDPKAVDRFYKALVQRCPSTEQGRQAAKMHWFPKEQGKN